MPIQPLLWNPDQYQLLDFGSGRKLERFGPYLLDRPCPAADAQARELIDLWSRADFRCPFKDPKQLDQAWSVEFDLEGASSELSSMDRAGRNILEPVSTVRLAFQLQLTPFGHVGLFPEQAENWRWLFQSVRQLKQSRIQCLNLFAYTGGATLAMAAAGASIVHVDASAPAVRWARQNTLLSGLQNRPIRWIIEDAFKFVQRELRRGNQYHIIVLDPPAYGHKPNGQAWKLESCWRQLLDGCLKLLSLSSGSALLWTGHSPLPSMQMVQQQVQTHSGIGWYVQYGRNELKTIDGRRLDQGYFIRATTPEKTRVLA